MLLLFSLLGILCASDPTGPVKWRFAASATGDGYVRIDLRTEVEGGWHIYATELPSDEGPIATAIRFKASEAFVLEGGLVEPEPVEQYDPNFAMMVRYHSGSPAFVQRIKPLRPGAFDVEGEVEYMVCNDRTCLPPVVVPFKLRVESM
ncbi:MAG: protein-disulfide reductase DsbD family protein [Flavobacteriales bacterium]|nr:MAG: protein-disulfide reductase DsbD family protein [Flavobacteriales bacterium]